MTEMYEVVRTFITKLFCDKCGLEMKKITDHVKPQAINQYQCDCGYRIYDKASYPIISYDVIK